MSIRNRGAWVVAFSVVVALVAGGAVLNDSQETPLQQTTTETLTPAPVPEPTSSPTGEQTETAANGPGATADSNASAGYAELAPTCERPPSLVVYIQVAALASNDPETNDGIRTTWRFAAPSNKQVTGPYSNFERLINASYRPLLTAEAIAFDAIDRTNTTATQTVAVTSETGNTTTYRWRLGKQSGGQYDGCWMTTSVRETQSSVPF